MGEEKRAKPDISLLALSVAFRPAVGSKRRAQVSNMLGGRFMRPSALTRPDHIYMRGEEIAGKGGGADASRKMIRCVYGRERVW